MLRLTEEEMSTEATLLVPAVPPLPGAGPCTCCSSTALSKPAPRGQAAGSEERAQGRGEGKRRPEGGGAQAGKGEP